MEKHGCPGFFRRAVNSRSCLFLQAENGRSTVHARGRETPPGLFLQGTERVSLAHLELIPGPSVVHSGCIRGSPRAYPWLTQGPSKVHPSIQGCPRVHAERSRNCETEDRRYLSRFYDLGQTAPHEHIHLAYFISWLKNHAPTRSRLHRAPAVDSTEVDIDLTLNAK